MSGHELDAHYIYTGTVAGHRMSYHEYVSGASYGLKYRAPQKRYLVMHLGLRLLSFKHGSLRPARCRAVRGRAPQRRAKEQRGVLAQRVFVRS
jgi:hypothetical protein